jgi:hypothetical protein
MLNKNPLRDSLYFQNSFTIPTNILTQYLQALKGEIIYPPQGSIRIAYLPDNYTVSWKIIELTSISRTLKQWFSHFAAIDKSMFLTTVPIDPNPENPFFGRKLFAVEGVQILYKNLRYRWLLRKFIRHIRLRIMERRILGEDDLCTTLRIPSECIVRVYDWKSKSVYLCHTQTIMKLILDKLKYNSYGIACPIVAKNPYTNIAFTFGQHIAIVGQIITNLAKNHRMIPDFLLSYRNNKYDIPMFFAQNKIKLHIHAACSFFANKDDAVVREITGEIMEDLYEQYGNRPGFLRVMKYVTERTLRQDLLLRWDFLLLSFWIYQNHLVFHGWNSHDLMVEEFHTLHRETLYWQRNRNVINQQRPVYIPHETLHLTQVNVVVDIVADLLENIIIDN